MSPAPKNKKLSLTQWIAIATAVAGTGGGTVGGALYGGNKAAEAQAVYNYRLEQLEKEVAAYKYATEQRDARFDERLSRLERQADRLELVQDRLEKSRK